MPLVWGDEWTVHGSEKITGAPASKSDRFRIYYYSNSRLNPKEEIIYGAWSRDSTGATSTYTLVANLTAQTAGQAELMAGGYVDGSYSGTAMKVRVEVYIQDSSSTRTFLFSRTASTRYYFEYGYFLQGFSTEITWSRAYVSSSTLQSPPYHEVEFSTSQTRYLLQNFNRTLTVYIRYRLNNILSDNRSIFFGYKDADFEVLNSAGSVIATHTLSFNEYFEIPDQSLSGYDLQHYQVGRKNSSARGNVHHPGDLMGPGELYYGDDEWTNLTGTYDAVTFSPYTITLRPVFALTNYTITMNQNGGSGGSLNSSTYNKPTSFIYIAMVAPTRTNYYIESWSTSTGSKVEILSDGKPYFRIEADTTGNLTLTPNWKWSYEGTLASITSSTGTGVTHTGFFTNYSGSESSDQTRTINSAALKTGYENLIATITRSGTVLGNTPTLSNSTLTIPKLSFGDIKIVYSASPITYSISYDLNGGSGSHSNSTSYNIESNTINLNGSGLSKAGYTFEGWYSGSTKITSIAKGSTGSVALKANWTANKYTVTFKDWNGTNISTGSFAYASTISKPANPTRTGYTFTGWSPSVPNTVPIDGGTYTAVYNINKYTITFKVDDGIYHTINQNYGTAITLPSNPTKVGYNWGGWDAAIPNNKMPAYNMTINATFNPKTIRLTLDRNGGSGGDTYKDVVYATTSISSLSIIVPTRTGYTFNGYYDSGTQIFTSAGKPTSNLTNTRYSSNVGLTASWTVQSFSIIFDSAGGTAVSTITQNYGSTVSKPANPTKVGHTFSKWVPSIPDTIPANNVHPVAQWNINSYLLSFDSRGGSTVSTKTVVYNSTPPVITNPTKRGYNFDKWLPSIPNKMPANNVHVEAQWIAKNIRINLTKSGGVNGTSYFTYVYDGTLRSDVTIPSRDGYIFLGYWDELNVQRINASGSILFDNNTYDEEQTLIARWQGETKVITYNLNTTSEVDESVSFSTIGNFENYTTKETDQEFSLPTKTDVVRTSKYYEYEITGWELEVEPTAGSIEFLNPFKIKISANTHGSFTLQAKYKFAPRKIYTGSLRNNVLKVGSEEVKKVIYVDENKEQHVLYMRDLEDEVRTVELLNEEEEQNED